MLNCILKLKLKFIEIINVAKSTLWLLASNVAKSTQLIQYKFIFFKRNLHLKNLDNYIEINNFKHCHNKMLDKNCCYVRNFIKI